MRENKNMTKNNKHMKTKPKQRETWEFDEKIKTKNI